MTIAVDFLDLAVADCVLMGAFPLPRRHGRSRDGAGPTLVDGIEGLVGVLGDELGRQRVYCRHCLCCCIRRGERRERGVNMVCLQIQMGSLTARRRTAFLLVPIWRSLCATNTHKKSAI